MAEASLHRNGACRLGRQAKAVHDPTDCMLVRQAAKEYDTHLQAGANIAGFLKVADAMLAQGVV